MPSSVITIQVGQCGNEIGAEFWKRLCKEHGIGPDGVLTHPNQGGVDRKEMFFYEADFGNRYVPRSVLVDLEPRVINKILTSDQKQLHDAANVFQSPSGGGAGNNWAIGYNQPAELISEIMEIVEREAENADSLEAFTICHSIAGGTGSGLGSKIIEQVRDRYPKTLLHTYSVFADPKEASDVIVVPYNSILALEWLIANPEFVVFLDNAALYRVATETMRVPMPSFDHINSMISRVMASCTAPMRFYSSTFPSLQHLVGCLNPYPPMQFLQTAYAPFTPADSKFVANTSVEKILARILEPKAMISSALTTSSAFPSSAAQSRVGSPAPGSKVEHCMLAGLAILQVEQPGAATDLSLARIQQKSHKRNISFAPWSSATLGLTSCRLSPYIEHKNHAAGVLLASNTNVSAVFRQMLRQYDQMRNRKAMLHQYEKEGTDTLQLMDQSRERVMQLVELYEDATRLSFADEDGDDGVGGGDDKTGLAAQSPLD